MISTVSNADNLMKNTKRIGLSLSGGGYRATAYHLGTLKKLRELKILKDIDVISSISGGSITSAFYGLNADNFDEFESGLKKGLKSNVVKGLIMSPRFFVIVLAILAALFFTGYLLYHEHGWGSFAMLAGTLIILYKFQFKLLPLSKIIEELYDRYFFGGKKLKDLSDKLDFAIGSTNLETGRLFTFSERKMADSSYTYPRDGSNPIRFKQKEFPIARAVAASACVPFAFTPVLIDKKFYQDPSDIKRAKPRLVDGGVYDNQGIFSITRKGGSYECDVIITSDAGDVMPYRHKYNNILQMLLRTSNIFMNRIKNFQMVSNVFDNTDTDRKDVAYFSLGWDIEQSIPVFMKSLKNGIIMDSVIQAQNITQQEIDDKDWDGIRQKVETNIGYENILAQQPTPKEVEIAREVATSLWALKEIEIQSLIKHASCLCELQVKLYCPQLIDSTSQSD